MRVSNIQLKNSSNIAIAKISVKQRQNTIKGIYDNSSRSPAELLKLRRSYDFKKEYTKYIEENYGDVISLKDKAKLQKIVEEHYNEGCIEDVADLKHHIETIGKRANILFDDN